MGDATALRGLEAIVEVPARGWAWTPTRPSRSRSHALPRSASGSDVPAYELRCIAVEPLRDAPRLLFGDDGWPKPVAKVDRGYALRDLVAAHRAAHRYPNAHSDLRDYHRERAEALGRAFGIDLLGNRSPARDDGLEALRRATEVQLDRVRSPFAGLLEAPETVIDLHRNHAQPLAEAVDGLHDRLLDLLVTIVARVWRVAPDATVTEDAVRASGFEPSDPRARSDRLPVTTRK